MRGTWWWGQVRQGGRGLSLVLSVVKDKFGGYLIKGTLVSCFWYSPSLCPCARHPCRQQAQLTKPLALGTH